jgi:hypothetical protein
MHTYPFFALIALDLARERAAEADAYRFAAQFDAAEPRPSRVRRGIARIALAVARAADAETAQVPLASH